MSQSAAPTSEPSSATEAELPPSSQAMPNDDEMAGTVISETQESQQSEEDWGEVPEEFRKWQQDGELPIAFR